MPVEYTGRVEHSHPVILSLPPRPPRAGGFSFWAIAAVTRRKVAAQEAVPMSAGPQALPLPKPSLADQHRHDWTTHDAPSLYAACNPLRHAAIPCLLPSCCQNARLSQKCAAAALHWLPFPAAAFVLTGRWSGSRMRVAAETQRRSSTVAEVTETNPDVLSFSALEEPTQQLVEQVQATKVEKLLDEWSGEGE